MTAEEKALEEAAAHANGESLSQFVRRVARAEAERVMEERTAYVIDDSGAQRFLDALEHPARSEAGLRRLADPPSVLRAE